MVKTMFNYREFGAGVRYYRNRLDLTQEALSEKVSVGDKFLSRVENGRARPSLELILKLCNTLGIGICDCFSREVEAASALEKRLITQLKYFTQRDKQFLYAIARNLESYKD